MKRLLLFALSLGLILSGFAQATYHVGTTEYYKGQEYASTGNPKVKRSEENKQIFLDSLGYEDTPKGYEIDHIIPLVDGGSDDKSNMQLLTEEEHKLKTSKEATARARGNREILTGPRGGKYYINKNGNKTYIKQ